MDECLCSFLSWEEKSKTKKERRKINLTLRDMSNEKKNFILRD